MSFLLTSGLVICLFLAILVLTQGETKSKNYLLGCWLLITAAELAVFYIDYFQLYPQFPLLIGSRVIFPVLHAPIIYIYVRSQFGHRVKYLSAFLHGIPFLLALGLWIPFSLQPANVKVALWASTLTKTPAPAQLVYALILVLYVFIYLYLCNRIVSERKDQNLDFAQVWLKKTLRLYIIVWSVVAVLGLGSNHLIPDYRSTISAISLAGFSVFIITIGLLGVRETTLFTSQSILSTTKQVSLNRYKRSGLGKLQAQKYAQQLKSYLENEKPYLKNKLSLGDLAGSLGISENHLSQVINETIGCSFSELINEYRIQEFKKRVLRKEFECLTLLAIAQDCGFHSKSAFISSFKKSTGLTPSQYKLQLSL